MIDYEEIFSLSYWRATQDIVDGVEFVDSFLGRLVASSEEIQAFFVHSTGEALRSGILLALVHLTSYYPHFEPDETLEEIAVTHNRHARAVKPHLYDLFLDHLIDIADTTPSTKTRSAIPGGACWCQGWNTSRRSIRAPRQSPPCLRRSSPSWRSRRNWFLSSANSWQSTRLRDGKALGWDEPNRGQERHRLRR